MSRIRVLLCFKDIDAASRIAGMLEAENDILVTGTVRGLSSFHIDADVILFDMGGNEPRQKDLASLGSGTRNTENSYVSPVLFVLYDKNQYDSLFPLIWEIPCWGIILFAAGKRILTAAIRAVAAGLISIDPVLIDSYGFPVSDDPVPRVAYAEPNLTPREFSVLRKISAGLPNKRIADILGISERTVKFHINSIFQKLHVSSRTEAVVAAITKGILLL
jgi:DNA-binding NarL/FixJ family response regulator